MNVKDLSTALVGIVVAILITTTMLVPIIASGLTVAGDPVEYTNAIDVNAPQHYEEVDDFTVTVETTADSYSVIANGVSMTKTGAGQPVIMSDSMAFSLTNTNSSSVGTVAIFDEETNTVSIAVGSVQKMEIVFNDGNWSISINEVETYNGVYSWAFTVDTNGKYVTNSGTRNVYVNDVNKDIVYAGIYETGVFDTGYFSYYNGLVEFSNPLYSGNLNYTSMLVDGTTDVNYITGRSITVTDGESTENFSAYRCLVKETIDGHKNSGVLYTLLTTLPIFVVIGLLLSVTYLGFINRRT